MRFEKKKKGPKKPCILALAIILALPLQGFCQTVEKDLVGLGMSPEVADYLAGIIPAGAALDNNVYLQGDNAAGSATINIAKINASDDTVINSSASDELILQLEDDTDRQLHLAAASDTAMTMKFGNTTGTPAAQVFTLSANSTDALDDGQLVFSGGGAFASTRGGGADFSGNEHATLPGYVRLSAGNVGGAKVQLINSAATGPIEFRPNGNTLVASADSNGLILASTYGMRFAAYVPTMVAGTPTPTVSMFNLGLNVIPTAAAAAAAKLPASPTQGDFVEILNTSPNEANICPGAGDTIASGGVTGSADVCVGALTGSRVTCVANSASAWHCHVPIAAGIATPGN